MDEERIGLAVARAKELRFKISNCIHKSNDPQAQDQHAAIDDDCVDEYDDDDEETQGLFNICDALEALENQLSSLQVLQQQQEYERESALADIESSRKILVNKLKEYRGKDLDVLQETSSFVGETVEHNGDLLLPPYPIRPPNFMVLDKGYVSTSTYRPMRNGSTNNIDGEMKNNYAESEKSQAHNGPKESRKAFRHFIGETLKTALTLVGVVSVLSLTGFGPKFAKRETAFNILGMFQQSAAREKGSNQCPDGKILVVENGEARCLVRERVEIPFDSVVSAPDVNYGCG